MCLRVLVASSWSLCGDLWGSCQFMITASDSFWQIVGGGVVKSCGGQEEIAAKVTFHAWSEELADFRRNKCVRPAIVCIIPTVYVIV